MNKTATAIMSQLVASQPDKLTQVELFTLPYVSGNVVIFVQQLLAYIFATKTRNNSHSMGSRSHGKAITAQITILPTSMNDIVGMAKDAKLTAAVQQFTIRITDGMPLVWLARLKGAASAGRLYGPDVFRLILAEGRQYRLRHYFYGGTPESLEHLYHRVAQQYPGSRIAGGFAPPFRDLTNKEFAALVADIKHLKPDVVWIGIGSWKQVLFTRQLCAAVKVPLVIPVGAAFDFLSGTKRQAPRWMMGLGLEWLFRLTTEPARLWQRYLLQIPLFIVFSILDLHNYYKKTITTSK